MGLMQQAYETYQYAEKTLVGVYRAEDKEPLAPVGHTITKANIEITINGDGEFQGAVKVAEEDEKTIFPVTEDSAGRTSKPVAHPLCEQLQYIIPVNPEKYALYIEQLTDWANSEFSHPALFPVLSYVKGGSAMADLTAAGLLKYDDKGKIKGEKDFIRWIVNGIGENSGPCWKNRNLHSAFYNWYQAQQKEPPLLCMINGALDTPAKQHAKGVVALNGNAKLISANDSSGFTYRGRFVNEGEALIVGYEASQKAHNALRWAVANHGTYFGGRCFVCWSPQGKTLPKPTGVMARRSGKSEPAYTPTQYREQLRETINGWKSDYPADTKAVTAVFDAATTGRLALTYYSEMQAVDFVDRLGYWDETCCWPNWMFGIQSPTLYSIASFAFGTMREDKTGKTRFEVEDKILKQLMLQLLACRMEKASFPIGIEQALVQRAGNLQIIPEGKEHQYLRNSFLFTVCAAIRKYRYDKFEEAWTMALEPEKRDRSYQFGRLMAFLEKAEKDTYDEDDKRETNIIRRQMAFVSRPYATTVSVLGHLKNAYYPQLPMGARNFYEVQIEGIMEILSEYPDCLDAKLEDSYLMGYYLQKKDLYTAKNKKTEGPK